MRTDVLHERMAAANPVADDDTRGWVTSAEGRDAFDDVLRMTRLGEASERPLRRRRVWPRRLALAGVAVVALAALGTSLFVFFDRDDGASDGEVFVAGEGFADSDGPARLVAPPPPDAASRAGGVLAGSGEAGPRIIESVTPEPQGARAQGGSGGGQEAASTGGGGSALSTPEASEPALGRGPEGQIVKTAHLEINVEERGLDETQAAARTAVDRAGGFIESSSRSPRSVSLTARVPSAGFEAVLDEVEALGEVHEQTISGDDVSTEVVDLEARLRHWRAQESVLLELMERATTVQDSIEVRRELVPVQETIERLEGRLRVLGDQVEFSTIDLFLVDPAVETPPEPDPDDEGWFSEVWSDATGLGRSIVRGTLLALGALIPIAALWVLPAFAVVALVRRRRSRAEKS